MERMHGKGSGGLDLCGFLLFEALGEGEGIYSHSCEFDEKWSCKRRSRRGYSSYSYISPQVANTSPETKKSSSADQGPKEKRNAAAYNHMPRLAVWQDPYQSQRHR